MGQPWKHIRFGVDVRPVAHHDDCHSEIACEVAIFLKDKFEIREGTNMQQCGDCLKIYDESEYAHCPFCSDDEDRVPASATD